MLDLEVKSWRIERFEPRDNTLLVRTITVGKFCSLVSVQVPAEDSRYQKTSGIWFSIRGQVV